LCAGDINELNCYLSFYADLDYNELTGVLPGEIFGNWKVLKELDLNNNLLG
jgi:hypothetical protein